MLLLVSVPQGEPASVADRQRTLRELEVGRTLLRDGDRWVIRHTSTDYKTGRAPPSQDAHNSLLRCRAL